MTEAGPAKAHGSRLVMIRSELLDDFHFFTFVFLKFMKSLAIITEWL